ncbi:MAG: hypothetical protein ACKV2V_09260 [Blastocatellia bacterium]
MLPLAAAFPGLPEKTPAGVSVTWLPVVRKGFLARDRGKLRRAAALQRLRHFSEERTNNQLNSKEIRSQTLQLIMVRHFPAQTARDRAFAWRINGRDYTGFADVEISCRRPIRFAVGPDQIRGQS